MLSQQKSLFIFGASSHAKVVIDIVEKEGRYTIGGLLDDNQALWENEFFGYRVLGGIDALNPEGVDLLVAVGDNQTRYRLSKRCSERDFSFARAVIHPGAAISRGVKIGKGSVVMAGAVINADTEISEHVIINTGSTVDHECKIGEAVQVAPGAHLCGLVHVGERTLVATGAIVVPNIRIGRDVIVGAGAVVVKDVPDEVVVMGVPARIVKKNFNSGY